MRPAWRALVLAALACGRERDLSTTVEVVRVAPAQILGDSLEVVPRLDTVQNAPEQGLIGLSIEMHFRNASGTTRYIPPIRFRTVAEGGRDTTPHWRIDLSRRTVDSLPPGQTTAFGLTTSAASLAAGTVVEGLYRVEAIIGDSASGQRILPLGRIRLRSAPDST